MVDQLPENIDWEHCISEMLVSVVAPCHPEKDADSQEIDIITLEKESDIENILAGYIS